jgi:hypothetical protein
MGNSGQVLAWLCMLNSMPATSSLNLLSYGAISNNLSNRLDALVSVTWFQVPHITVIKFQWLIVDLLRVITLARLGSNHSENNDYVLASKPKSSLL